MTWKIEVQCIENIARTIQSENAIMVVLSPSLPTSAQTSINRTIYQIGSIMKCTCAYMCVVEK